MKLWFEGWNVNAQGRIAMPANSPPAVTAAPKSAINRLINSLAVNRLRGDSAANDSAQEM
jgi:hypothetical protein